MLQPWAKTLPPLAYTIVRDGYLAVSVFFVLSGFVLARSYGETVWTSKSLTRYAIGRAARVYPVYALSILVVAPYIAVSSAPEKSQLVANYVLLLQGWTGKLAVQWNTPAWSLSCEIFFYLCFPLAAIAFTKLSARVTIAVACLICLLPALLWSVGTPDQFKPLIHLADFLIGVVASRAYGLLRPSLEGRGQWLYLPAAAVLYLLLLHPVSLPALFDFNGILRPFIAIMLLGFALSGGILNRILSARLFVYLGKSSYSLYILHIPLLWWFKRWSPYWFAGSESFAACVYIIGALAVSAAVYSYIEEPANHFLRNLANRPSPRREQTLEPSMTLVLLPD